MPGNWVSQTSKIPKRKSSPAEKTLLAAIKKAGCLKSKHRAACDEVESLVTSITGKTFIWGHPANLISQVALEGAGWISLPELQQALDRLKES